MIYQGAARYPVREVILHTSATGSDWWHGKTAADMAAEIDSWHRGNGWKKIGYHFVVAPDGTIAEGRRPEEIGAHVKERNRGTIGVCLIPVREVTEIGTFEQWYTPEQNAAVRKLIRDLAESTAITQVSGHNQFANKLCPGFWVKSEEWLAEPALWARFLTWMRGLLK